MKPSILAIAILAHFLIFVPGQDAAAQVAVSGDARVGITFPLGDLAGDQLEAGLSLAANANVHLRPNLRLYTGVNHHSFRCTEGCLQLGAGPRITGLGAGLQYRFLSPQEATWWARVGGVAHRFSSDVVPGDWNVGLEAGVGIDMPLGDTYQLTPHVGIVNHGLPSGLTAQYMTFGLGLHRQFR